MDERTLGEQTKAIQTTWDSIWKDYRASWGPDYEAALQVLLEIIGDCSELKSLEPGCGSGIFSMELARRGANTTLLDISDEAIEVAKSLHEKNGISCNAVEGTILDMPFRDDYFDVCYNMGVLEHFRDGDKQKAIGEMFRVTKPDGKIIVTTSNRWAMLYRIGKLIQEHRGTWAFGYEDILNKKKLLGFFEKEGGKKMWSFAYNPAVSIWMLPRGDMWPAMLLRLGVDTDRFHRTKCPFGQVLVGYCVKS